MKYPCTGHVDALGFGAFLEAELGAPRKNLQRFADELAQRFAVPHVTLVNSGSSANLVAAHALAGTNRRAVVSAFTFPTTVSALRNAGFEVSFVDARPNDCQIDPRAIPRDVGLVALTHFLGWPAPIAEVRALGIPILQDACETFDMRIGDVPIAALAEATTLSFYHPHHLSSFGGGAVLTHDAAVAREVESIAHWGRACTHHLPESRGLPCPAPDGPDHNFWYLRDGFNVEMSELNACFGRWSLARNEEDEARRTRHFAILHDALAPVLQVREAPDVGVTPFVFPITVHGDDARPLIDRLLARGVEARSWMGGVIADQPAFRELPNDGLRNARAIARRSFFVGIHHTLAEDEVRAVARIVAEEAR